MPTPQLPSPSSVHQTVLAFLLVEIGRQGDGATTQIELLRGRGNGFQDSIRTWRRTEEPQRFEPKIPRPAGDGATEMIENPAVRDFSFEIVAIAEAEAGGQPGKHRFTLRSIQAWGGRQTASFVIAISNDNSDGDAATDLEPTTAGQTALIMRGFSDLLRVNKEQHASTLGVVGGIAREQMQELKDLRKENAELHRKVTDLENDKTEREWKIFQEQKSDERSAKSLDRVFQLGSVAVSALFQNMQAKLPPGTLPADGSPIVMMLAEFFGSITPEQGQKMLSSGLFQMPQLMMLQSIKQLVDAQMAANAAAASPPPNGANTSPSGGAPSNGVH